MSCTLKRAYGDRRSADARAKLSRLQYDYAIWQDLRTNVQIVFIAPTMSYFFRTRVYSLSNRYDYRYRQ